MKTIQLVRLSTRFHSKLNAIIALLFFQNVSVFIHHPDFDTGSLGPNNRANWVQLMTINKIRDQPDLDISYQYVYERDSSTLRMALWTMVCVCLSVKCVCGWGGEKRENLEFCEKCV